MSKGAPTLVLVLVLSAALILGGACVFLQVSSGGMTTKWNYFEGSNLYTGTMEASDGTLYAVEALGAHNEGTPRAQWVALDQGGHVKWKNYGFDDYYATMKEGPDGRLYTEALLGSEGSSDMGRYLICIEPNGELIWRLPISTGAVYAFPFFADGSVVVENSNIYDEANNFQNILWISPEGEIVRTWDLAGNSTWHQQPLAGYNGTMILFWGDLENRYESIFDERGNELWRFPSTTASYMLSPSVGPIFFSYYYEMAGPGLLEYRLGAFDTRNASWAWNIPLMTSNEPAGTHIHNAVVGKNQIYLDDDFTLLSAFSFDGILMWSEPVSGYILGAYPSGGVLLLDNVHEDMVITKMNTNGDPDFSFTLSTSDGWTAPIFVGASGSIYYSHGGGVTAYSQSWLTIYSITLVLTAVIAIVALVKLKRSTK